MAYSKLWFRVILSRLTDRRLQLNLDHSLPTGRAGRFRTNRWSLVLLAAQSQAPDSQAAALQATRRYMLFAKLRSNAKEG
jgi:hypothetical protein